MKKQQHQQQQPLNRKIDKNVDFMCFVTLKRQPNQRDTRISKKNNN